MFASGIKAIYKKINDLGSEAKKKAAFLKLEAKISSNPLLKHQFDLLTFLKENKNSVGNPENLTKFMKEFKTKSANFLKESNASHLKVWNANKQLLEYFNINPKDLPVSLIDSALDIYSTGKSINESAIKKIVSKKSLKETDERATKFLEKTQIIKEAFSRLVRVQDLTEVKRNFRVVNFLSESLKSQDKAMVQASLLSLFEEKDYQTKVKKLYKLRVITEKKADDLYGDEEDELKTDGGGQKKYFQRLKYIDGIEVETKMNYRKPNHITISFKIPFWPIGVRVEQARTSALLMKEKIQRLERTFINLTIYQKSREQYWAKGTFFDTVKVREQAIPGEKGQVKVVVYLNTNQENKHVNDFETLANVCYDMLQDFDNALPALLDDLADMLTPDAQQRGDTVVPRVDLINKHIFGGEKDAIQDNNDFPGSPFGGSGETFDFDKKLTADDLELDDIEARIPKKFR